MGRSSRSILIICMKRLRLFLRKILIKLMYNLLFSEDRRLRKDMIMLWKDSMIRKRKRMCKSNKRFN